MGAGLICWAVAGPVLPDGDQFYEETWAEDKLEGVGFKKGRDDCIWICCFQCMEEGFWDVLTFSSSPSGLGERNYRFSVRTKKFLCDESSHTVCK